MEDSMMDEVNGNNEYIMRCWFCTCEFDVGETSFCNHTDPTLICPYCLKCGCEAPDEYKNDFLKNCPKKILEEKLILESRSSLRLGEILIRAGKITRNNLIAAIEKQQTFKERIGQIFIMMKLLTPEELSIYLREQKGMDHIELTGFELDFDLVEKIGRQFCLQQKIIPIELYQLNSKKILRLVIYSGDDLLKLKKSGELRDYVLIPYDAPRENIDQLLAEIYDYDVVLLK
jgi:hypothetical protein